LKEVFGYAGGAELKAYHTVDERGNKYTVPQPFKLTEKDNSKKTKTEMLKEQQENKFKQDCTFKPKTLEGANKDLIMEVLVDNYDFKMSNFDVDLKLNVNYQDNNQ